MEYKLGRYEHYRNNAGEVTSIFLSVVVSDGVNSTGYEHWLSGEEFDLVMLDEANLKPILVECYAKAELKMENEVATRPQPTVYPLKVEGKKEELEALVKVADIDLKKAEIAAEAEAVEAPVE